jgi:hypothetical protein
MQVRPLLHQFLDILDDHRVSVFELLLRSLGRVLTEEEIWQQRGSVKRVPAVTIGRHVVLSPQMAHLEAASLPDVASMPHREMFVRFQDWWQENDLPPVAEVHVPRGAMWVDVGSPDGVHSFYGHIRGADRIHLVFPFTKDDDALGSVDGESHEVEFALEIAVGDASRRRSHEQHCHLLNG